jgi:hypothetical protein
MKIRLAPHNLNFIHAEKRRPIEIICKLSGAQWLRGSQLRYADAIEHNPLAHDDRARRDANKRWLGAPGIYANRLRDRQCEMHKLSHVHWGDCPNHHTHAALICLAARS